MYKTRSAFEDSILTLTAVFAAFPSLHVALYDAMEDGPELVATALNQK